MFNFSGYLLCILPLSRKMSLQRIISNEPRVGKEWYALWISYLSLSTNINLSLVTLIMITFNLRCIKM